MRILLVHNYYQQGGGEDAVFHAEHEMLKAAGHSVEIYSRHNDEIDSYRRLEKLALPLNTIWSHRSYHEIRTLLQRLRPHLIHSTNTFPVISPSIYDAASDVGIPIVQNVQNYRFLCPSANFMRDGKVCESCLHKFFAWPGIVHACYRNSRVGTAVVASLQSIHRLRGTLQRKVDAFIVASEFSRQKLIEGGLPAEKLHVKPNFLLNDPGERTRPGDYALFVGRLAPEKGVQTLLTAWRELKHIPLKIIGDGPEYHTATQYGQAHQLHHVEFLGRQSNADVLRWMKGAQFLVFPSEWYEGFPVTIVEAMACGLPILASRLGAMVEAVDDGRTGQLFCPGDANDLAEKVRWADEHPDYLIEWGHRARAKYEAYYTPERNYSRLMAIYEQVLTGASLSPST